MNTGIFSMMVLLIMIIMYIINKIPYIAISITGPVILYLSGILSEEELLSGLTNSGVILATAMFIIGGSFLESGMAQKVSFKILGFVHSERTTMLVIMCIAISLSSFLSNIGTTMVLLPIVLGICEIKKEYTLSRLLIPMAFGCSLGGMNTLIGAPLNVMGQNILSINHFDTFAFFEFGKIGMVLGFVAILFMYFIGYNSLPKRSNMTINKRQNDYLKEENSQKRITQNQFLSAIIFIISIIGMIMESIINIPVHIIAVIGVVLLLVFRVVDEKKVVTLVDWRSNSLVMGMIPMTTALMKTGVVDQLTEQVIATLGHNTSPIIFMMIIFVTGCIVTNFISNTATAALLFPIGIAFANTLHTNPQTFIMTVIIASGLALSTPLGTPCNTVVMGYGNYHFKDYMKVGIPLTFICSIIALMIIPFFWPL